MVSKMNHRKSFVLTKVDSIEAADNNQVGAVAVEGIQTWEVADSSLHY